MTEEQTVLITGAAGLFGGILRSHWGNRYQLRLADVQPVENLAAHEAYCETDIVDYPAFLSACRGVDTLIHLAAYPGDGAEFYDTLLRLNIIGGYNAFQAAHEAGCRRIVFASSIDAVGGYAEEADVGWDRPVYPTTVYGATKCWGEALGRVYAQQHGLSVICVRLCNPHFDQGGSWGPDDLISGISPRDAAALFSRCVDVDDVAYAIVNGISNHRRGRLDLEITRQVLGFEPEDGSRYPH
jgi:NAD+ dependent glucose-6-phosphate dehydrogenase